MTLPQWSAPVTPYTAPSVAPTYRLPLVSPGEWDAWPTGVSAKLLSAKAPTNPLGQLRAILDSASEVVDAEIYGPGMGQSWSCQAQVFTTSRVVTVIGGEVRIGARVTPIQAVLGVTLELPSAQPMLLAPQNVIVDGSTVRVLVHNGPVVTNSTTWWPGIPADGARVPVTMQWVGGWPHLALAESATAGDTSIVVEPNGTSGLVGVAPGTILRIWSGAQQASEVVAVATVTGTTLGLVLPLRNSYPLPAAPDFVSVSAVPMQIREACAWIAAATIVSGGASALTLSARGQMAGGGTDQQVQAMLDQAGTRLNPFRVMEAF